MMTSGITRAVAWPGYALCRCFCHHFVTLTGTGLAACGHRPGTHETEDWDND